MTPEEAWNEAMKLENRANPYPFFEELHKTPVARVANGVYAVTGLAARACATSVRRTHRT